MGRHVLVTGASRGIGAAIALAFAKNGDDVGVNYNVDRAGAEETARRAREFGVRAEIYQADVGNSASCEKMFGSYFSDFGTIGVLVNNAGGGLKIPQDGFLKMPISYWDQMIALNLSAAAYCSHFAVPNMVEHGIRGKIINISSVHSFVTYVRRFTFPYCAAKGGLNMFTKTLGVEVIKYGINVNAIAPGFIKTTATTRYSSEEMRAFLRKIPAGRLGSVDDITPLALFLADDEKSRFIVGQTFLVDGGQAIDGTIDYMLGESAQ